MDTDHHILWKARRAEVAGMSSIGRRWSVVGLEQHGMHRGDKTESQEAVGIKLKRKERLGYRLATEQSTIPSVDYLQNISG